MQLNSRDTRTKKIARAQNYESQPLTRAQFYGWLIRAVAVSEARHIQSGGTNVKSLEDWTKGKLPELQMLLLTGLRNSHGNGEKK